MLPGQGPVSRMEPMKPRRAEKKALLGGWPPSCCLDLRGSCLKHVGVESSHQSHLLKCKSNKCNTLKTVSTRE